MTDEYRDTDDNEAIDAGLEEDDRAVLRLWRESLSLLDGRYHSKNLLDLAARSMTDDDLRSRLVEDGEVSLADLKPPVPETKVRFFENSRDTLNVVLPPRAGEIAKRSPALRDALRSKTMEAFTFFEDEWDLSNKHIRDTIVLPDEP